MELPVDERGVGAVAFLGAASDVGGVVRGGGRGRGVAADGAADLAGAEADPGDHLERVEVLERLCADAAEVAREQLGVVCRLAERDQSSPRW